MARHSNHGYLLMAHPEQEDKLTLLGGSGIRDGATGGHRVHSCARATYSRVGGFVHRLVKDKCRWRDQESPPTNTTHYRSLTVTLQETHRDTKGQANVA